MITFPNCKINIGLNVVKKRKDGYHNIETVFYPVQWCDALEIIPAKKLKFVSSGIKVPSENNLCLKAYHLLNDNFALPPVQIHLLKKIPTGAGLGGGSSDAAFTLKMLNRLFSLGLNEKQLMSYAGRLGSDCPFFIKNKPALAFEKGNKIQEIKLDLSDYKIIIVSPGIHSSTADAYSSIVPKKPEKTLKTILQTTPITQWKDSVKNDFEKNIFKKIPQVKQIKKQLYRAGALYASMSGSGSAVYAIFEKPKADKMKKLNYPIAHIH